jgi:membrane associated rhomboid family serine protease
MNVLLGVQSLNVTDAKAGGGVAVFAHIGGFVAGLLAVGPFSRGRERRRHRSWDGWRPVVRR